MCTWTAGKGVRCGGTDKNMNEIKSGLETSPFAVLEERKRVNLCGRGGEDFGVAPTSTAEACGGLWSRRPASSSCCSGSAGQHVRARARRGRGLGTPADAITTALFLSHSPPPPLLLSHFSLALTRRKEIDENKERRWFAEQK